ncbi:MAG TPA: hypothetical protein VKA74_12760 [Myxococcota bacterium]|nr:hypothetical protein [Myxococcota bacterium]
MHARPRLRPALVGSAARIRVAVIAGALASALLGCAVGASFERDRHPQTEADRAQTEADRAARITALRAAIEQDHAKLKILVSTAREGSEPPLHEDPELRAIARRLGPHEDELELLLARRDAAESARVVR